MSECFNGTITHARIIQKTNPSPRSLQRLMLVNHAFCKAARHQVLWESFKTNFLQHMPHFVPFFEHEKHAYKVFGYISNFKNLLEAANYQQLLVDLAYLHILPELRNFVKVVVTDNSIVWEENASRELLGLIYLDQLHAKHQWFFKPLQDFLRKGFVTFNRRPFTKEISILHVKYIAEKRKRRKL